MLEPVVGEQDVHVAPGQCERAGGNAIRSGDDRAAAATSQQHRLVPEIGGLAVRRNAARRDRAPSSPSSPITSRDDPGTPTARHQQLRELQDDGSLAGPADGEIADHHDGHRQAPAREPAFAIAQTAQLDHHTIEPGERREDGTERMTAVPDRVRVNHLSPPAERIVLTDVSTT